MIHDYRRLLLNLHLKWRFDNLNNSPLLLEYCTFGEIALIEAAAKASTIGSNELTVFKYHVRVGAQDT